MIDTAEDKVTRVTVHVETAGGVVIDVELVDHPDHPLDAQVGYRREVAVVPPERATQQMWLEHEAGPVAFSQIRLEGMVHTFKRARP